MKKRALSFYYITLAIICQVCLGFWLGATGVSAAGVNDFYFENFVGDYYLTRDAEGISHLTVEESMTAVFPNYNQNKGICRQIPYTNQAGANVTLAKLGRGDIEVLRNGASEPIYSIEKENGYYNVCTGTDEYLLGRQRYTLKYNFDKVVTDFSDYQELYWDTNGNGAQQRFTSVTARVHFASDVAGDYMGKKWCYVGRYGSNSQERCEIRENADGVEFYAEDLAAGENLTFDVELKPGSFVVPEPENNYTLVMIMVAVIAMAGMSLIYPIRKYLAAGEKRRYYKGYFVKPEYQPHAKYSVAEMTEIYLGSKKEPKVAVLLDLIVRKKVDIMKEGASKKKGWKLVVKSLEGVKNEGKIILQILNGGVVVQVGDTVEVKARTATSALVALGKKYGETVVGELKSDGLAEEKYKLGGGEATSSVMVAVFIMITVGTTVLPWALDYLDGMGSTLTGRVIGVEAFLPVVIVTLVATIVAWVVLIAGAKKYIWRTKSGLEMSRYMDGLKLYIKMAETDRLKFLQSVDGADISAGGVVRLYEKLLPYAAVFGLEDSWMHELERYYKMDETMEPDWYMRGITMREMYAMTTLASRNVSTASTMSSSGGGASSDFSGGGGGGFSGGGGGGGGFSGR